MKKFYKNSAYWRMLGIVILLFCMSIIADAQAIKVSGTVTDEKGGAVPGVTVTVKNTTNSVATDKEGKYSISLVNSGTLLFKFLGYTTQEVAVKGQTTINVSLVPENSNLNEVIVTGVFDKRTALNSSIAISSLNSVQMKGRHH
jgi:iron complex outermembrane receptor protein